MRLGRTGRIGGASLLVCVAAAVLAPCPASAAVYWNDNTKIGAARLDGTEPSSDYFTPPFPSDSAGPGCGVALSAGYLYWVGAFGIGRVNLEGPAVPATVVGGLRQPCGIAVDQAHAYWANREAGAIGRANLDGSESNPVLVAGLERPCNVAVDGSHLYWIDQHGIGRAGLDGSEPEPRFMPMMTSCGLAAGSGHIYWGEYEGIGRANLDGSEAESSFVTGIGNVASIATDGAHIYWTDRPEGMSYASIGRANLDGSGVAHGWIPSEQLDLGGVAVDGRASPPPLPLPSRPIRLGRVAHDRRGGSVLLDVWVPERGELVLTAPKLDWKVLEGPTPPPWRGGAFRWRLEVWPGRDTPAGARIRTQLRNRGRALVTLRLAYREENQLPVTAVKRLALLKTKVQR